MADIFLSYAREDLKKAEMLANALENQGWTVFWDRTSLLAGQDFETVIHQAIQQAGCMVVAWSEASRLSNWVRGEADIACERNIIVPILFEPVELPIAFRSLHTENLSEWEGEADAPSFLKLCKAIKERLNSKTAPGTISTPFNKASNNVRDRANSNSLKLLFRSVWAWLSVTKHQQTLAFIGGGLAVVIGGSWQGYLLFSKKPADANPTISISDNDITKTGSINATATNGGYVTNVVGNNNTIGDINSTHNIKEIVRILSNKHLLNSQAKDVEIRALTEAVTALTKGQNTLGTKAEVNEALKALKDNDTTPAKALFAKAAQKADQVNKEKARAYRNLGALAYLDNSQEALQAYSRANKIDNDNNESRDNLRKNFDPLPMVLENDSEQPISIDSNTATYDDATATSIYTGNVICNQGNIRVDSEKLVVYFVEGEAYKLVFTGNTTKFVQTSTEGYEEIKGEALTVEYYPKKNLFVLKDQAIFLQGKVRYWGDLIEYDSKRSIVNYAGDQIENDRKVSVVLVPKQSVQ